jgi:quercetin dioxygenase-like cupin family protein
MTAAIQRIGRHLAVGAIAWATGGCRAVPAQSSAQPARHQGATTARVLFSHALPPLDGRHLELKIVEVAYGPGGSSPPHSHPCPVIGYVIKGALRTQVKGEPAAVYRAGQSFYEDPNGVHLVSANASDKDSVRFLAYFTCDHETPLSVPVPDTARGK